MQDTLLDAIAEAVSAGLTGPVKTLPAWLFYDEIGSQLFERITLLPEYYVTRTERAILAQEADHIVTAALLADQEATCKSDHKAGPGGRTSKLRLIELGAGTATKTGILLAAAVRRQGSTDYLPIDVSASALDEACASIADSLPQVTVHPLIGNYVTDVLRIPPHAGPTLALYIGSSIGNFAPAEAVAILQNLRAQLRPGDTLLLGTDLVKDKAVLESAYCDAEGVTEAFNLNMLQRLNRELNANFDLSLFHHAAYFNQAESRIEMHLRSVLRQTVHLAALNLRVSFAAGETIHTENSYKFTDDTIRSLLQQGGFELTQTWTDARHYFAVTLATVGSHAQTPE